jgi:hypothetical protein
VASSGAGAEAADEEEGDAVTTTALGVLAFAVGALMVVTTVLSAIMTLVVPRAFPVRITRWVFFGLRVLFKLRAGRVRNFQERDRSMALYGPISLFGLAATWLVLTGVGYMLLFWSLGVRPLRQALELSGSSIYTLGFAVPPNLPTMVLTFSEAGLGLVLLAMLISYLPSMYQSFSRREAAVAALDVRADTPPTATAMLIRVARIEGWERLDNLWRDWETWFVDVTETHTSLPALVFFRSPHWEHSWVTASGAVLDGASLFASTVDRARSPDAELCIRAGYVALRRIADFFGIEYDPDPHWPDTPISIDRREFDEVCRRMVEAGVPLRDDLEQAWRDFAGWRVNYDRVLLSLASLTMAPYAPWSSDRSILIGRGRANGRWTRSRA